MNKIMIITSLLISVSSFADSHEREEKKIMCSNVSQAELEKDMQKHHDKWFKKLNLTKDQKQKVDQIHKENKDKIFAQVQKLRAAHTDLMAAIEKNDSKEAIKQRISTLGQEKQNLINAKVDEMLAVRDVLTPEQQQKAIEEIKEKKEDMCD